MPETATPTETSTPTATYTPSATPTATPNYYIEVTTPAGEPARIARQVSVADTVMLVLLFGILISLWLMYLVRRLRRETK